MQSGFLESIELEYTAAPASVKPHTMLSEALVAPVFYYLKYGGAGFPVPAPPSDASFRAAFVPMPAASPVSSAGTGSAIFIIGSK